MFKSIISFFRKFWFKSANEEMIPAPCVGDLIEYKNGIREMVAVVDIDASSGIPMYDVRFFKSYDKSIGKRGRSFSSIKISDSCENWPPKDSMIIRDGKKIHPISSLKLSFLHWLNTKL